MIKTKDMGRTTAWTCPLTSGQGEDGMGATLKNVKMSPEGRVELAALVDSEAVRPITYAVGMDMHRNVPVLSGDLQDTISVDFPAPLIGRVYFGDVDTGVDYHLYVEFGTSKMAAQPFARPSIYKIRSL